MNIDLHNHVIPKTLADAIVANLAHFGTKVETRNGIPHFENRSMWTPLSAGPPIYSYYLKPDQGLDAARLANDGIAQMVQRSSVRYVSAGCGG
jgi:hypothetical protein